MKIQTHPLTPERLKDFEAYFEYAGTCSGCWCMNHRLPTGLDFEGEAAKLAMRELIKTQRVFGVLAYVENDQIPVGWVALDRRKTLPGHDCIGEDIKGLKTYWSIHCVTSRKDYKQMGVETQLVKAATVLAEQLGATTIEAYPEPDSHPEQVFKTWNTFSGYHSDYSYLNYTKKKSALEGEFFLTLIKQI